MRTNSKITFTGLALALALPAFHATAQQTAPSVTAPYTDYDGTTEDPTVFTDYTRNPGHQNDSFSDVDANTYEIFDQQAGYFGNPTALALVGVSNFNGNSNNGALNNFTFSSKFSVIQGTGYAIGLTSYTDGYPLNNRDTAPTFALHNDGTLTAFDNVHDPEGDKGMFSSTTTNFANPLLLGAVFSEVITGTFSNGTTLTLSCSVTEVANNFNANDPNIGHTAKGTAVEGDLITDFGYNPQFGYYVDDSTYNTDGNGNGAGVTVDFSDFSISNGVLVPEPSTLWLSGVGAVGLCWLGLRSRK